MFDGIWKAVSGKLGTDTIPLPDTTLHIDGDNYVVDSANGRDEGKLVWGGDDEQPTVDMRGTAGDHRGHTIEALARVRGDHLQLCYAVDGSGRPRSFAVSAGIAVVTVRYRRITP
jgi:uncharacterized protein (TIGR03067 family)